MESKGLKMNIDKTKVMRSGKGSGDIVKTGKCRPVLHVVKV